MNALQSRMASLPRETRDTTFLLLVIGWIMLPHVSDLPVWCSVMAAGVLLWRGRLAVAQRPLPGRWALLAALGLALAFRSNVWNIGAEGQFVMGAVFAGGVALAADAPIDSALTVTGRIGSTPALSLKGVLAPPAPEQVITDVVVQGTGRTVNEGDGVLLSVSRFSGTDGANTTGSPSGRRLFFRRLDAGVVGEAIDAAVVQAAEGSRIVLRSSVESSGGRVAEVTVVDVLPTLAAGAAQTPAAGTPSVALAEDGTVSVGLTGLAAPTRSTAAVVIRGEGSQVSATDTIVARYTIVSWSGGTVRTTNYGWTAALGTIDMTDTLAGLAQGLVDVPVGSRVVLSLPADQARGDEPVAVVVDVLAIVEGGAAPSDAASAPATP